MKNAFLHSLTLANKFELCVEVLKVLYRRCAANTKIQINLLSQRGIANQMIMLLKATAIRLIYRSHIGWFTQTYKHEKLCVCFAVLELGNVYRDSFCCVWKSIIYSLRLVCAQILVLGASVKLNLKRRFVHSLTSVNKSELLRNKYFVKLLWR